MKQFVGITKALSDFNRVRAMMFLRHGELCVCQIVDMLQLAPSTVSKHMSILAQAGLIEARKDGRWHYYRWAGDGAPTHVRAALKWMVESLEGATAIKCDDQRRTTMIAKDLQDLCCHYKDGKCSSQTVDGVAEQSDATVLGALIE